MKPSTILHMGSPPRCRIWLEELEFLVTSDISPELISCAIGLRFYYVDVRPWGSKLALAIYGTGPDLLPLKF